MYMGLFVIHYVVVILSFTSAKTFNDVTQFKQARWALCPIIFSEQVYGCNNQKQVTFLVSRNNYGLGNLIRLHV